MSYAPPAGPPPSSAYASPPPPGQPSYAPPPQTFAPPAAGPGGFVAPPQVPYTQPVAAPAFPGTTAPIIPGPGLALYLGTEVFTSIVPPSIPEYNPEGDVKAIHEACKGWGTDNKALVRALVKLSGKQMQILQPAFKRLKQKDLVDVLKKETSGTYRDALVLLVKGPLEGDAYLLKKADELEDPIERITLFTEIIIARPAEEIELLRQYIRASLHVDLDNLIINQIPSTMMGVRTLFRKALKPTAPVAPYTIESDCAALVTAFDVKTPNSGTIVDIVLGRPLHYLNALCNAFSHANFGHSLADSIKRRYDGLEETILVYAVRAAEIEAHMGQHELGVWRDAKRLEDAMEGRGTDERALTYRLIRSHWDRSRFQDISRAYAEYKSGKITLLKRIEDETSGNFGIFAESIVQLSL